MGAKGRFGMAVFLALVLPVLMVAEAHGRGPWWEKLWLRPRVRALEKKVADLESQMATALEAISSLQSELPDDS